MLDVYRNYYGLTGEPFRLGPDYRFSLHHESYASAKAYLEYAIYQGEGFIAITGEPGTGKTTLISEILAGLDPEKVQVATLTSTQLESRDLLYMVANSFDLHPADTSKANLLLELESFLVRRIRVGQRAILVVDEAQGLSAGALEELRLLANLQHKYQLLLQIFLVGQEQLLDLINAPGMEHLRQRLVAATSLKPLNFDETVDYIEHRLSKVAWKGDPAIDEDALRELYRYSGGVPRRINLIANRLFLNGGMEEKHRFDINDSLGVIQGLIDEFLLAPKPLIDKIDIAMASNSGDAGRSRSLPRDALATTGELPHSDETPVIAEPLPLEEPSPASGVDARPEARPDRVESGQDAAARKPAAEPARKEANKMERPVPRSPTSGSSQRADKKTGGKGIVLAIVVLAGAGAFSLMREPANDQSPPDKPASQSVEVAPPTQPVPEQKDAPAVGQPADDLPAKEKTTGIVVRAIDESKLDDQPVPEVSGSGKVVREPPLPSEPVATVEEPERIPEKAPPAIVKPDREKIAASDKIAPSVPVEPAKAVEHPPAVTVVATARPDASSIEARLSHLKESARQRFLARQAEDHAKANAEPVVRKPEKRSDPAPVKEALSIATPDTPTPVKQESRFTLTDIMSTLMDGRWSSRGKPASLLPSETTFCNKQSGSINCLSVPQNIKTQYGLALYKVETTLSGFSPQGHFEMSYKTLVKLVGTGAKEGSSNAAVSDNSGWQASAYSMSCKLEAAGRVSCVDGKGVTREYRQASLPGKQQ